MKSLQGFRLLWLAATTSALGDGMRWVALPLLAVRQSTDPWTISLITAAEQAPWLLFGLVAGVLTDRYDRRRLVRWSDLARAAAMAAFAVAVGLHATPIAVIATLGFLLTCGEALTGAALSALIPALVPSPARPAANGRLQAGTQITDTLIGTAAGAALFGALALAPFAIDAATFIASAACVTLLRLPTPEEPPDAPPHQPLAPPHPPLAPPRQPPAPPHPPLAPPHPPPAPPRQAVDVAVPHLDGRVRTGRPDRAGGAAPPATTTQDSPVRTGRVTGIRVLLAEIADGVRFLWSSRLLRGLCLLQAVTNTAFTGVLAILVLFSSRVLGLHSAGFGLLVAVFAVGGVAGGLAAGRLARRFGVRRCLLVTVAGSALWTAALSLARTPVEADVLACLLGFTSTVSGALTAALRQDAVPDAFTGRVTSAFRLVSFGVGPAGALAAGALAHSFGLRSPFLAGGALIITGLLACAPMIARTAKNSTADPSVRLRPPQPG